MPRERIPLDGAWRFRHEDGPWRTIQVPGVWQAQFDDLRLRGGRARYERDLELPVAWRDRRLVLCFGAVDYACRIEVNGEPAGEHEGGYLPFELDLSALFRPGRNRLAVEVVDPAPGDGGAFPFAEIPHGKQSWYGPLGGIWQSVHLEARAPVWVQRAYVHAGIDGTIAVETALAGAVQGDEHVRVRVVAPGGGRTFAAETRAGERVELRLGDPERWSPATPRLYRLEVEVGEDRLVDHFGLRQIEARDGRILLNGEPIYLRGALDQDYYLGGIATPPSDELLRDQALRARELGLNLLRCHIKVPDPRYLRWADRLGLLVWSELPNWGELTEAARSRARETLRGMVERDCNHPSIVIWTIVNESWGIDLAGDGEHRRWLAETLAWARELDPTRLWVDNSACPPSFHVASDLNDFHIYHAFPDGARHWEAWTAAWVADPSQTWSPHGDAARSGEEPLVLSEFGTWGLPDLDALRDDDGRDPWWTATGGEWGDGVVLPEGVRERFAAWRLDEVFGSWRGFVRASQEHQLEGLQHQIRDLRRHDAICGYVVTELTDVHWECNGLLDMARRPKALHERLGEVNAEDVVLPLLERPRAAAGEELQLELAVSHFSGRDLDGARATLSLDGRPLRTLTAGPLARGRPTALVRIALRAPQTAAARRVRLEVELDDRHGRPVARGALSLLVLPAPSPLEPGPVHIARRLDGTLRAHLEGGGRAVLVAGEEAALPDGLALRVQERRGSRWHGDWAQGMGWLRPRLAGGLALGPRLDSAFLDLAPEHVLLGYEPAQAADVLAGLYVGWIHATAATVARARAGAGALVLCTLPLLDAGDDPLAAHLLARLVEIAA